jgi:AraC-like DNA-binding protein
MMMAKGPISEPRRLAGAKVRRVIDASHADIPEHAHDWPLLSLFVIGSYRNRSAFGELEVTAPSAVYYAAGAAHANRAGATGFEQIEIEFDPAWLASDAILPKQPLMHGLSGRAAAASRRLARLWSARGFDEIELRSAMRALLAMIAFDTPASRPPWLDRVHAMMIASPGRPAAALAAEVDLHPAWLGQAYHAYTGEPLAQAAARRRVEQAAWLLRETATPAAEIALIAGFYDQSHMTRAFRRLLGRTPGEVRRDRHALRTLKTSNP